MWKKLSRSGCHNTQNETVHKVKSGKRELLLQVMGPFVSN